MQEDLKTASGWIIKQANERPQFIVEHEDGSMLVSNQCNFLHCAFPSQTEAALGIISLLVRQNGELHAIIAKAKTTLEEVDPCQRVYPIETSATISLRGVAKSLANLSRRLLSRPKKSQPPSSDG